MVTEEREPGSDWENLVENILVDVAQFVEQLELMNDSPEPSKYNYLNQRVCLRTTMDSVPQLQHDITLIN